MAKKNPKNKATEARKNAEAQKAKKKALRASKPEVTNQKGKKGKSLIGQTKKKK